MQFTIDSNSDGFSREMAAALEIGVYVSGEPRTGERSIDNAEDDFFAAAVTLNKAWRAHQNGESEVDHKAVFIDAVRGWTGFDKAGQILDASIIILNYAKPNDHPKVESKEDFTESLFRLGTERIKRLADDGKNFNHMFTPI